MWLKFRKAVFATFAFVLVILFLYVKTPFPQTQVSQVQVVKSSQEVRKLVKNPKGTCSLPYYERSGEVVQRKTFHCPKNAYNCNSLKNENDTVRIPASSCRYRFITRKGDFDVTKMEWVQAKNITVIQSSIWKDDQHILELSCPSDVIPTEYCIFRKISRRNETVNKVSKIPKYDLDIMMIGLDSLSRHELLNQLSKTYDYLTDTMGGVSLQGYTIVGDGTTAAIMAILFGTFEDTVHETRRGFKGATSLDDLDSIWKHFHAHGYVTLRDEVSPWTGTFQYRLLGFDSPPVHYYGRPFQLASNTNVYPGKCLGNISRVGDSLDYIHNLYKKYPDKKKFAVMFNDGFTHSEYPEAYLVDSEIHDFIKGMRESGKLESTLLVFFSDHGPRYGKTRQTLEGKYRERSPYCVVVLPEKFQKLHPGIYTNLKSNGNFVLTTPFDIYATFAEILGIKTASNRGISLFSEIPPSRTCEDASVEAHWCPCANDEAIKIDSSLVKSALKVFVDSVNEDIKLPGEGMCHPLEIARVFHASIAKPGEKMASFKKTVDGHGRVPSFDTSTEALEISFLNVIFETKPGDGTWEVTFELKSGGQEIILSKGQISRTNAYGEAPSCLNGNYPYLRPFCFCSKFKSKFFFK